MPAELEADYRALRSEVGAVMLARDVVLVAGPDAVDYLQGQLSQEVAAMEPGSSALSLLLEPQGRLVAFLRVSRLGEDRFALDTDAGGGPTIVGRLNRFKLRTKVDISLAAGWRCVALRGPEAPGAASGGRGEVRAGFPWPGCGGVDLLGPDVAVPEGVRQCSEAAWDAVRIEAGLPVAGRELDERTIPHEAGGLVEATVSFTKGCYTGQELVARIDARGAHTPRRLRGVVTGAGAPEGAAVMVADRQVGALTSVAVSPVLGTVALAYVRREVEPPAAAILRWPENESPAQVEALPLSTVQA